MTRPARVCYYLTSHGFGHSVRACAVCEHLAPGTELHIRTGVPRRFFEEELIRTFEYSDAVFDCGCLQSDSVTVDVGATVDAYARIEAANARRLADEVRWLQEQAFDAVVCDSPPFPIQAARAAGIPAMALSNFTWYDVYSEYVGMDARVGDMLEGMRAQYASADLLLEATPSLPMEYFPVRVPVGVVGRRGSDVRQRLVDRLGCLPSTRLALLYLGTFGMDMPWSRLAQFEGWVFLSSEPLPGAPANLRVFDRAEFQFRDVAASVDAVFSKLGYATVTSCMLNAVPLVYLPRAQFAEYPALERGVREWGGGIAVSEGAFRDIAWGGALGEVAGRGATPRVADMGAALAARTIESVARAKR